MTIGPFSVRRSMKSMPTNPLTILLLPIASFAFWYVPAQAVKSLHANIAPLIYCLPSSEQLIHVEWFQAMANVPNAVAGMQTIVLVK